MNRLNLEYPANNSFIIIEITVSLVGAKTLYNFHVTRKILSRNN